jgi:uncharacterized protein YqhQ
VAERGDRQQSCQGREAHKLGGQAVIEGVMIKGPRHAAVAVRAEDGTLKITARDVSATRRPPWSWPVFRGVVILWQTMALGMWALDVSAREAAGEEEGEESPWMMVVTVGLALSLGVALFFWLPLLATQLVRDYLLPALERGLLFNLVDGVIRLLVFVLYVVGIGFIPGIGRIFQYHGAEHKMVFLWEREGRVDPAGAGPYSTHHPRCGTSFLLTVMVVSILFFSLIPKESVFWIKFLGRLFFLPLIAGLSFEIIRLADRSRGPLAALFMAPGLWLQGLTTREPDPPMLEVAAAALEEVLRREGIAHD